MKKPGTVRDYGRRVEKVAAHIASLLDEALDLDTLAAVASFSPCHVHRIYRYVTGETAADTLRRLRLHRAAGELMQGADKKCPPRQVRSGHKLERLRDGQFALDSLGGSGGPSASSPHHPPHLHSAVNAKSRQ